MNERNNKIRVLKKDDRTKTYTPETKGRNVKSLLMVLIAEIGLSEAQQVIREMEQNPPRWVKIG